MLAGNKIKIK